MKRLPTRRSLTEHVAAVVSQGHYWVVKDNKTQTESGFETEQEARTRAATLAAETGTTYRYTVYKVPGRF